MGEAERQPARHQVELVAAPVRGLLHRRAVEPPAIGLHDDAEVSEPEVRPADPGEADLAVRPRKPCATADRDEGSLELAVGVDEGVDVDQVLEARDAGAPGVSVERLP